MDSMTTERLNLHSYGPFDLPKKDAWVVVGSGPTAGLVEKFVHEHPNVGVISLNAELVGIPYSTVHIVGHYEYYLECVRHLFKPEILFFANPMPVGFRCVDVSAINLLDFEYFIEKYPGKLRFFEKETDKAKLLVRNHTLYCHDTIASTALHLLALNKVKDVYFCGIDGHDLSEKYGRHPMFSFSYRVRVPNGRVENRRRYDDELKNFLQFGKEMELTLNSLSEKYNSLEVACLS